MGSEFVASFTAALRIWLHPAMALGLVIGLVPLLAVGAGSAPSGPKLSNPTSAGDAQGKSDDQQKAADPQLDELKKKAERLKAEKEIAETQHDIAKAQRDRLGELLPKPETKPLEGKLSVDDKVTLEIQILTYGEAERLTNQIAQAIAQGIPAWRTLVVFDQRTLGALASYRALLPQLDSLGTLYDRELPAEATAALPGLLLAPEIVGTMLKSAADVVALFRSDVDIRGVAVALDKTALVAQLTEALRSVSPNLRVIYPPVDLPLAFLADPNRPSVLLDKLRQLSVSRVRALAYIRKYEAESDEEKKNDPLRDKIDLFRTLNDQTDKLTQSLIAVDEKTGLSVLASLLLAEQLLTTIGPTKGDSGVLYFEAVAAGGSHKLVHSLWRGNRLFENGGVVLTYLLIDGNGTIVRSGTLASQSGYQKR